MWYGRVHVTMDSTLIPHLRLSSGSPRSAHVIINVAGPYMLAEGEVDVQNFGTTFDIIMT